MASSRCSSRAERKMTPAASACRPADTRDGCASDSPNQRQQPAPGYMLATISTPQTSSDSSKPRCAPSPPRVLGERDGHASRRKRERRERARLVRRENSWSPLAPVATPAAERNASSFFPSPSPRCSTAGGPPCAQKEINQTHTKTDGPIAVVGDLFLFPSRPLSPLHVPKKRARRLTHVSCLSSALTQESSLDRF